MRHHQAFTFIDLLVPVAIIGTLAIVLYPVIAGARKNSNRTVCISNLRQCGVALKIFMDDNGIKVPPDEATARTLLGTAPVCCPADQVWNCCTQPFGKPMIGSYAYVRSVPGMEALSARTLEWFFGNDERDCILMVDVFHSSHGIPAPYHAEITNWVDRYQVAVNDPDPVVRRIMPDNVIRLHADGRVDTSKQTVYNKTGDNIPFTWSGVMELNPCMSSEYNCTWEERANWLPVR